MSPLLCQDPKDKRRILLDEKLSTIFPGKSVTMFTMNKHLSKHCKTEGEAGRQWVLVGMVIVSAAVHLGF